MYAGVKPWNPFIGCKFRCTYCVPSFQRIVKWVARMQKSGCKGCQGFLPHEHPGRLTQRLPGDAIIWPCAHGDISFARPDYIKRVIERTKEYPKKTFYWQSKSPKCFEQYLSCFPENTILLTTLETNRDEQYNQISRAPVPSVRFDAFLNIKWPRKIVTIEPILDFDGDEFLGWMWELMPESVWIGYNSKAKSVKLPEPPTEKTLKFIKLLESKGITVKRKTMR